MGLITYGATTTGSLFGAETAPMLSIAKYMQVGTDSIRNGTVATEKGGEVGMNHNVPIQSLIDHIKTAIDVDDWAKEMLDSLLTERTAIARTLEGQVDVAKCFGMKNITLSVQEAEILIEILKGDEK